MSSVNTHGRLTETLGSNHLVAYMVSTAHKLVISTDANPVVAGEAFQQSGTFNQSSISNFLYYANGLNNSTSSKIAYALGSANGTSVKWSAYYENDGGSWLANGVSTTACASYTVAANGAVTGCASGIFLVSKNTGVLVDNSTGVFAGQFMPQTVPSGGFTTTSLAGNYFGGTTEVVNQGITVNGEIAALSASGNISITQDKAGIGTRQADAVESPTFTTTSTGSLTLSDNPGQVAGLAMDSTHFLIAGGVNGSFPRVNVSGSSTADAVAVTFTSPTTAQTVPEKLTLPITAHVTGTTNTGLTWTVNGVTNGNATFGTITGTYSAFTYTAPTTVPSPATFNLVATSNADVTKSVSLGVTISAGVVVAITTPNTSTKSLAENATQSFVASVSGTSNTGVTWKVNGITNGNNTYGTITGSGLSVTYNAPATVPSAAPFNVTAISTEDPTKSASVSVTITP